MVGGGICWNCRLEELLGPGPCGHMRSHSGNYSFNLLTLSSLPREPVISSRLQRLSIMYYLLFLCHYLFLCLPNDDRSA